MSAEQQTEPKLLPEQEAEGYSIEMAEGNILIWHKNTQIALLLNREGVEERARQLVEKRRQELREVSEKTGWKPE
jgi:hypothetical protein